MAVPVADVVKRVISSTLAGEKPLVGRVGSPEPLRNGQGDVVVAERFDVRDTSGGFSAARFNLLGFVVHVRQNQLGVIVANWIDGGE